jgi:hypothetical protein
MRRVDRPNAHFDDADLLPVDTIVLEQGTFERCGDAHENVH